MKIQNNQQGVITDASQNNQQGVITGQNQINKFLSVQEPVGKTVVRFKENFAIPISPSNPYYSLFFHSSFDGFSENITNEINSQRELEGLKNSDISKIFLLCIKFSKIFWNIFNYKISYTTTSIPNCNRNNPNLGNITNR